MPGITVSIKQTETQLGQVSSLTPPPSPFDGIKDGLSFSSDVVSHITIALAVALAWRKRRDILNIWHGSDPSAFIIHRLAETGGRLTTIQESIEDPKERLRFVTDLTRCVTEAIPFLSLPKGTIVRDRILEAAGPRTIHVIDSHVNGVSSDLLVKTRHIIGVHYIDLFGKEKPRFLRFDRAQLVKTLLNPVARWRQCLSEADKVNTLPLFELLAITSITNPSVIKNAVFDFVTFPRKAEDDVTAQKTQIAELNRICMENARRLTPLLLLDRKNSQRWLSSQTTDLGLLPVSDVTVKRANDTLHEQALRIRSALGRDYKAARGERNDKMEWVFEANAVEVRPEKHLLTTKPLCHSFNTIPEWLLELEPNAKFSRLFELSPFFAKPDFTTPRHSPTTLEDLNALIGGIKLDTLREFLLTPTDHLPTLNPLFHILHEDIFGDVIRSLKAIKEHKSPHRQHDPLQTFPVIGYSYTFNPFPDGLTTPGLSIGFRTDPDAKTTETLAE